MGRVAAGVSKASAAAGVVGATGVQGISRKSVLAWGSERSKGEVWKREATACKYASFPFARFASFAASFSALSAPILLFGISVPTKLANMGKLDKT